MLGLVFLGAWIYVNDRGGWTLATGTSQRGGSWPFWLYDVAFSAAVLFFCVSLWAPSNREGRLHVQRTAWLVWLLLATFPLSDWGQYGPTKTPALGGFPWDTLIELGVGVVAFAWGVPRSAGLNPSPAKDAFRLATQSAPSAACEALAWASHRYDLCPGCLDKE